MDDTVFSVLLTTAIYGIPAIVLVWFVVSLIRYIMLRRRYANGADVEKQLHASRERLISAAWEALFIDGGLIAFMAFTYMVVANM